MSRCLPLLSLIVILATTPPGEASAQRRGSEAMSGWPPVAIGARFGYDDVSNGEVVGAQIRIPILPSGVVELVPNGDITFLTGLKDKQLALDAVWVSGGRSGGLYLGVGYTWRRSIYDVGVGTETKTGLSYVGGVRGTLFGAPFGTQLEVRWIRVDERIKPRTISFGVNFPLWGEGSLVGR